MNRRQYRVSYALRPLDYDEVVDIIQCANERYKRERFLTVRITILT